MSALASPVPIVAGGVRGPDDLLLRKVIADQRTAAEPRLSVWASANAGSGKTKVLIDRIARLLLDGADPGKVLAVTYTKAAAAEMQTRLFEVLGGWTVADDARLSAALLDLHPDEPTDAQALVRARSLFARALETPGGLKIQTIHAFCQMILQRFPLEAGVAPGFEVLEDEACTRLAEQALERAARAAPAAFAALVQEAPVGEELALVREAARHAGCAKAADAEGPALARLAAALGVPPDIEADDIRRAAGEMIDPEVLRAAAAAYERVASKPTDTSTKAAALLRSVLAEPDMLARHQQLTSLGLVSEGKAMAAKRPAVAALAKEAAIDALLGPASCWDPENWSAGGLFGECVAAERKAKRVELARRSAALTDMAIAFRSALAQAKAARGALDFDDLLAAVSHLLRSDEAAARWVLFKLDQGIAHILIDEAQDTSPDQWDLMAPLFAALEEEAGAGRPRTRFVVGDEKQSIYSFQGASPERFAEERWKFEANEAPHDAPAFRARRATLDFGLSFRTAQVILDAVEQTLSAGAEHAGRAIEEAAPETKFFDAALERQLVRGAHAAFRTGQSGIVERWPLAQAAPDTEADQAFMDEDGLTAAWMHPLDAETETSAASVLAKAIATDLRRRLDAGESVWSKDGRPRAVRPSDVMILVRRRNKLFHAIIRALKLAGVPVAGADVLRLTEDQGVQDLLALARFAVLPEDDFNLACVLRGAFCGLTDDDAHLFPLAWARGVASLWSRLQASDNPAHAGPRTFLERVLGLADAGLPPYEVLASILEAPMPDGRTGWRTLIERLGRETREPVEALLARALAVGRSGVEGLSAFVESLDRTEALVKREADQNVNSGVRVMTVHGAKGLEAPIVILPDTTGGIPALRGALVFHDAAAAFLWSPRKAGDTPELAQWRAEREAAAKAESRRLLYVAMTRARDRLILCGAWHGVENGDGFHKDSWWSHWRRALAKLSDPDRREGPTGPIEVWGQDPPPATTQALPGRETEPVVLPGWLNRAAAPEPAPARRVAPSALAPDGAEPPALSPLAEGGRVRFRRGRLIHTLLQRLPDLPAGDRAAAARARLSREADLDEAAREEIVAETLGVLGHPDFAALFGPDSRAEAALAGRGEGLPEDLVVNGSVDRLVVLPDSVLVVDFKTNRPPPELATAVSQAYLAQMAAYRALLRAAWPGRRVRCALLWTDGPRLMDLPDDLLDAALKGLRGLPSLA